MSKVKEIVILGQMYLAEVEEEDDFFYVTNPVTLVQTVTREKINVSFAPVSIISPFVTWKVPKDHVYSIDDTEAESEYDKFMQNLKMAALGLEVPSQDQNQTAKIKKLH